MRYVIFLLLALNCAYLAWELLQVAPETTSEHSLLPPLPRDIRPLVTLKERDERESRPETRKIENLTEAQPPGAGLTLSCQALGPFLAESELGTFEKRLDRLGLTAKPQTRYVQEQVGYTLRLPSLEYEEALQIKRRLEKENIEANFVGLDNTLSLGAFRDSSQAKKALQRAHALGFEPHLEPDYARRSTYWLVFHKRDDQIKGITRLTRKNPDLRVESMACP